jgi:outer membrane protein assembly factor BamB
MRTTSFPRLRALLLGLGATLLLFAGALPAAQAEDWPNWRGPAHDGISREKDWSPAAVAEGKVLWRANVGRGYSSFAVADGKLYTMGNAGGQDSVFCFEAETGKELWSHSYPCRPGKYAGPRGTPTVHDGLVYTMSREGLLLCFDAATGKVKWQKKVDSRIPRWGIATSPIVHGDLVVVNAGGAGAAFNKKTGKRAWQHDNGMPGYASPVPYVSGSKVRFLIFAEKELICVSGKSGRPLWDFAWPTKYNVLAADPVLVGKSGIFISSGYGKGCAMLRAGSRGVSEVWKNTNMRNHMASCVLHEDHLYGFDDKQFRCIDTKKGGVQWTQGGLGKGAMSMADGKLIILSENGGQLVIAEATPKKFTEIARTQVFSGHTWTPPVLANGRIYCRNDAGDITCLDVRGR